MNEVLNSLRKALDGHDGWVTILVAGQSFTLKAEALNAALLVPIKPLFPVADRVFLDPEEAHTGRTPTTPMRIAPTPSEPRLPYAAGSDTSQAAAESMRSQAGVIRERVYKFVKSCAGMGATCDEIEYALGLTHQTCSARVNELEAKDRLMDSGERRETRSGRKARVLVTLDSYIGDVDIEDLIDDEVCDDCAADAAAEGPEEEDDEP